MEKGTGFKRIVIIAFSCFFLTASYGVNGRETAQNLQEKIRTVVEGYFKKIDQPGYETWKLKRDSALLDNFPPAIFPPGSLLHSYTIAEIKPVIRETRDFKQINAQNEPFSKYQRIKRDSRHYQKVLIYLETIYRSLLSKNEENALNLLWQPSLISRTQTGKFVHQDKIEKYKQTKRDVLKNLTEMTRLIYSDSDFSELIIQVTTLRQKIRENIEDLQALEVDEKIIEQQSGVYLAYELYDTYCLDSEKMESVLGRDYRTLKGRGTWHFEIYDVICDITINTNSQARVLKLEDEQWIVRVVRFDSDTIHSGWRIWHLITHQE